VERTRCWKVSLIIFHAVGGYAHFISAGEFYFQFHFKISFSLIFRSSKNSPDNLRAKPCSVNGIVRSRNPMANFCCPSKYNVVHIGKAAKKASMPYLSISLFSIFDSKRVYGSFVYVIYLIFTFVFYGVIDVWIAYSIECISVLAFIKDKFRS